MPNTETDVTPPVARVLPGQADTNEVVNGMIVTFDVPCTYISDLDILFVRALSGEPLRLLPDEQRDDSSVYVFFGLGTHAPSLRGLLERLDDRRWRFSMTPPLDEAIGAT